MAASKNWNVMFQWLVCLSLFAFPFASRRITAIVFSLRTASATRSARLFVALCQRNQHSSYFTWIHCSRNNADGQLFWKRIWTRKRYRAVAHWTNLPPTYLIFVSCSLGSFWRRRRNQPTYLPRFCLSLVVLSKFLFRLGGVLLEDEATSNVLLV